MGTTSGIAGVISSPQGGRVDMSGLVQLAMMVKQQKIAEQDRKKAQAQQKAEVIMKNPSLMVLTDPKDLEKTLKDAYDLNITGDKVSQPGIVDPASVAAVGKATQGSQAGAQSATPPSDNAAQKAPGGGVEKTGTASTTEHLVGQAKANVEQNMGPLSQMYSAARSELATEQHKLQVMNEIETLKEIALGGGPQSIEAHARLASMAGQKIDDATIRGWVIAGGGGSDAWNQALGIALGNETGADKAKRYDNTLKNMMATPQLMDKLENPTDAVRIANSVVYSGTIPSDIKIKSFTMQELKDEADYESHLMKDGDIPYEFAHLVARGRSLGIPPTMSLPGAMSKTLFQEPIAGREAGAKQVTAQAALLRAQADKEQADDAHSKINQLLSQKDYDQLNDRIKLMIEADKAKHPWPDDVKQGYINQLAKGTGLQPEQVQHWYNFMTKGSWEYTPIPDDEAAKKGAGSATGKPPAAKRGPTFAEQGGLKGFLDRNVPKDEQGRPMLNPFELEHELLLRGRTKALQYLRDLYQGTDNAQR